MGNPLSPVTAPGGPIPPPVLQLPWGKVGPRGDVTLTSGAYEFLQLLWSAIQGGGGIIDIGTLELPNSGVVGAVAQGLIEQDARSAEIVGAALGEIAAMRQDFETAIVALFGSRAASLSSGVTITGAPVSGNLTEFSSSTSITNGDLSGDVTTAGTLATTLATVNPDVGTFGDGAHSVTLTVNAKGLVTAITQQLINLVNWVPSVNGAEPPSLITDGAGELIFVAYTP